MPLLHPEPLGDAGDITGRGDGGQLPSKVCGQLPISQDRGLPVSGHGVLAVVALVGIETLEVMKRCGVVSPQPYRGESYHVWCKPYIGTPLP